MTLRTYDRIARFATVICPEVRSPLLAGFAALFDFHGNLVTRIVVNPEIAERTVEEALQEDMKALYGDWEAIGKDMLKVFTRESPADPDGF